MMIARPFILLAVSMLTASVSAQVAGKPVSFDWLEELQATLTNRGISLDATNTSRAALLAAVRTFDGNAALITEAQWQDIEARRTGQFMLTGLRIGITNGLPLVMEVPTNSPAATAGIEPGDRIIGIGTQQFAKISLPDALHLLKAGDATNITLRYVRGATTNSIDVGRERLEEPAIEVVELFPNNIGYIKINGLYPGSGRDVVSRVRASSENERDGIVIDLRGAGGYDVAAATQIAGLFSRGGQFLFAFRDHNQQDLESYRAAEGAPVEQPVMVLIDHETRGAAEVLAAAINGSTKATLLIGEPTEGDFMLREPVIISGHRINLALRVLDTADGIRYTGQHGVDPAILISGKDKDTRDYDPPVNLLDKRAVMEIEARDAAIRRRVRGDGALERAVDIIIGLKSLNKKGGTVSSEP